MHCHQPFLFYQPCWGRRCPQQPACICQASMLRIFSCVSHRMMGAMTLLKLVVTIPTPSSFCRAIRGALQQLELVGPAAGWVRAPQQGRRQQQGVRDAHVGISPRFLQRPLAHLQAAGRPQCHLCFRTALEPYRRWLPSEPRKAHTSAGGLLHEWHLHLLPVHPATLARTYRRWDQGISSAPR